MYISRLEPCIKEFDGITVSILSEARVSCRNTPGYFEDLITLCFDPRLQLPMGLLGFLKQKIPAVLGYTSRKEYNEGGYSVPLHTPSKSLINQESLFVICYGRFVESWSLRQDCRQRLMIQRRRRIRRQRDRSISCQLLFPETPPLLLLVLLRV